MYNNGIEDMEEGRLVLSDDDWPFIITIMIILIFISPVLLTQLVNMFP